MGEKRRKGITLKKNQLRASSTSKNEENNEKEFSNEDETLKTTDNSKETSDEKNRRKVDKALVIAVLSLIISAFSFWSSVEENIITDKNNKAVSEFNERQLYFEPFSGLLEREENESTKVNLVNNSDDIPSINIPEIHFVTYQGAISQYTIIHMDRQGNTFINSNHDIEIDVKNLKKKVYDANLWIEEISLLKQRSVGDYKYYDGFLMINDFTGKRKLYLITILIDGNSNVLFDDIYDKNILAEAKSEMILVDDVTVEVQDENTLINRVINGEKVQESELYACYLSESIMRYQQLYQTDLFTE